MSRPSDRTASWEWIGIVSALLIVAALPAYYLLSEPDAQHQPVPTESARFVGSTECRDCHNPEYESWEGSHHDLAMAVASEETVLGDFNDTRFTLHGVTSRFYKKDGRFFVHTNGPGGEMGDFEITHTFGWFPLQQYLIPFPGGRLQTLPLAWDSRDSRWFRVPPEGPVDPDDWLYWTNAAQNWNGMCAQCHSTNLEKNYDPEADSYATTWSDINVGCEACHGPGSEHVEWAEMSDMARPQSPNFELAVQTSDIGAREHVELCAPCHSRRSAMGDYQHAETDLLDNFLPSLLTEELYFADGQIMEEVYVYGSFIQSKMYRHDVRCSDCHDVHSIERVLEGNALCLQCHRAAQFDTPEHHFHKREGESGEPILSASGEVLFEVGTGSQCVECHMPGRYYMGNDYRPDHSFRIPDPILSAATGSPDACLRCHVEEDSQWSQQTVTEWYGPGHTGHYGDILAEGRAGNPAAADGLLTLAGDPLYPVNVRATAIYLLAAFPGEETLQAMEISLADEEALVRRTAVSHIQPDSPRQLAKLLGPMLYDPSGTVRTEAARRLVGDPAAALDRDQRSRFETAIQEFEESMLYAADFPYARHNLANLYASMGRTQDAIVQYEEAIRIDDRFFPAKTNLALLFNQQGLNGKAEMLLREVVESEPELYDQAYSLGLLLVEMKKYREAIVYLERAAQGLPERARIHYNLGLLHQYLQNMAAAEVSLRTALELEPGNPEFQFALADHLLKLGRFEEARPIVESLMAMHPENPAGRQMMEYIQRNTGR
jgi:tetratricopeptide (TPR) repeat protein